MFHFKEFDLQFAFTGGKSSIISTTIKIYPKCPVPQGLLKKTNSTAQP